MRSMLMFAVPCLLAAACASSSDSDVSPASSAIVPGPAPQQGDGGCSGSGGSGGSHPPPAEDAAAPTEGGASGEGGAPGYFHTSGTQIVDATGTAVRITGVSWFGLETNTYAPHGLWQRKMGDMLDQIKNLGFNALRVPYSNQLFDQGSTPNGIDFNQNPDLVGLTGLQIMDKVVAGAGARGLRVFLDRHRPDSGAQSALWYTDHYDEARWISDWTMLAQHYAGNPTVIGADLHNEPHDPATWGDGNAQTDWKAAAERAGNAILAVEPDWLMIVEGVSSNAGTSTWWGGDLAPAAGALVTLNVPNRVVYSPHDYPASVYGQSWFSAPNYPANLPSVWDGFWGYLVKNGVAPVLVGEFGTLDQTTSDQEWLSSLVEYIGQYQMSFTFWCYNPDSGDTGGIVQNDWQTVNQDKMNAITPILAPLLQ